MQFKCLKKFAIFIAVFTLTATNFIQLKGYTMEYRKTIAIDLDGVLDEYTGKYNENNIPDIRDGAKDFIIKLSKDYKLILFTTRESFKAKDWLIENDINQYFSDITNIKPPAFIYLDDRALKFDGDYDKTLNEIKNYKVYWKNN